MSIHNGWAFTENETEKAKENYAEYTALKEAAAGVTLHKTPAYGHCKFRGELTTDAARALTDVQILLIADGGNLCFGGTISRCGDTFSGSYSTD